MTPWRGLFTVFRWTVSFFLSFPRLDGKIVPKTPPSVRWRAATCRDFHRFPTISIPISFLRAEGREKKEKRGEEKKEHTVEKGVIPKIWNKGGYRRSKIRSACVGKRFNFSNPLNFSHSSNTAFPRTGKRFHPTADHSGDPVGKKRNSEWKDAARQD